MRNASYFSSFETLAEGRRVRSCSRNRSTAARFAPPADEAELEGEVGAHGRELLEAQVADALAGVGGEFVGGLLAPLARALADHGGLDERYAAAAPAAHERLGGLLEGEQAGGGVEVVQDEGGVADVGVAPLQIGVDECAAAAGAGLGELEAALGEQVGPLGLALLAGGDLEAPHPPRAVHLIEAALGGAQRLVGHPTAVDLAGEQEPQLERGGEDLELVGPGLGGLAGWVGRRLVPDQAGGLLELEQLGERLRQSLAGRGPRGATASTPGGCRPPAQPGAASSRS